ncbi:MAG: DUF6259 domain-containing protein [Bacilli bacterium]|nr:DUF6259 domain-containing protein [Bacilli bacterium]
MKEYILGNVRVALDLENGRISSIEFEKEELVRGEVPFAAVKLRNQKGEAKWFDTSTLSFGGEKDGYLVYEGDLLRLGIRVCEKDGSLIWRMDVENKSPLLIEQIEIMSTGFLDKLVDEGGKGAVVFPFNEGALVTNLTRRLNSPFGYFEAEYPSLGRYCVFPNMLCSQFLAYIVNGKGVYFGMHDPRYSPKHLDFLRANGAMKIQMRTFANLDYGESYHMPFDGVMTFFKGDYFDAFEVYRKYFESRVPAGFIKIKDSKSLPSWYEESPLVVTYPVRGHTDGDKEMLPNKLFPYANAIPCLKEISEATSSKVMTLLMHWEGSAPWAPPYSWPPYGGEDMFDSFVKTCHEEDILVGLYTSGLGWTNVSHRAPYSRIDEFNAKHLEKIMCANSDKTIKSFTVCEIRDGYDMCPACETTKELIQNETNKILAHGIDYLQVLDQNHGGCSYFCYSPEHGHNPSPGEWQIRETKKLLDGINLGSALLGCESGAAEPFLDQLQFSDNRFILNYYIGLPIPMYAYLYHEYVNNFMGNQICLALNPDENTYPYRLAYSFCCGDMFTLVLNDEGGVLDAWGLTRTTDKGKALNFIRTLNEWRREQKEFLHAGKMKKPLEYECEKTSFTHEDGTKLTVDSILSSAFEYEGETLQLLVNFTGEKQMVRLASKEEIWLDPKGKDRLNSEVAEIAPLSVIAIRRNA